MDIDKGRRQKRLNFPYLVGSKNALNCQNVHLKATYFFHMAGGLTLKIFLRSKRLLDLPDLEIFLSILDFFNGKK